MTKFVIAPVAKSDLLEIWNYYAIEAGDVELADRIRDEIFSGIRAAVRKPELGHLRRDLVKEPLRFWRVRNFLIIYRIEAKPLQVVRVLHGARDVQAILSKD